MWIDKYSSNVCLSKAQVPPLKVGWLDLKERVIDIGVLGRWRRLEEAMNNYDINEEEWE